MCTITSCVHFQQIVSRYDGMLNIYNCLVGDILKYERNYNYTAVANKHATLSNPPTRQFTFIPCVEQDVERMLVREAMQLSAAARLRPLLDRIDAHRPLPDDTVRRSAHHERLPTRADVLDRLRFLLDFPARRLLVAFTVLRFVFQFFFVVGLGLRGLFRGIRRLFRCATAVDRQHVHDDVLFGRRLVRAPILRRFDLETNTPAGKLEAFRDVQREEILLAHFRALARCKESTQVA